MIYQILHNDILAHEPSVESVSRAASALLMENGDSKLESGALQMKVTELQNGWQEVLDKAARLDTELAAALSASHDVMDQMKELRTWLSESREFLYSRRQIGGRPESARNQIAKHKVCLFNTEHRSILWSVGCPSVAAVIVVFVQTPCYQLQFLCFAPVATYSMHVLCSFIRTRCFAL